jgi:hypothetical protein
MNANANESLSFIVNGLNAAISSRPGFISSYPDLVEVVGRLELAQRCPPGTDKLSLMRKARQSIRFLSVTDPIGRADRYLVLNAIDLASIYAYDEMVTASN